MQIGRLWLTEARCGCPLMLLVVLAAFQSCGVIAEMKDGRYQRGRAEQRRESEEKEWREETRPDVGWKVLG